jgi:RNA polymerase sigma-70 factor (ECF subfamily)
MPLQEHFWRIAYYILESKDDASDAVQDLYLKLWGLKDNLDLIQSPKAYGGMLLKNLCIDRVRRAKPSAPLEDTNIPGKDPPDRELAAKEDVAFIGKAIQELPPGQRKLLTLRVVDGLSYEEISKKTGLSGLNARVQISQARKKLKKKYEEYR